MEAAAAIVYKAALLMILVNTHTNGIEGVRAIPYETLQKCTDALKGVANMTVDGEHKISATCVAPGGNPT